MTYIERELSVITSTDPLSASFINANRSRWKFDYPGSITFPDNARDLTVEVPAAQVWYSSHLVRLGVNDLVTVGIGGVSHVIQFPPGLWSVFDLNTKLQELIAVEFNTADHANKITLEGEAATGKIKVVFSIKGTTTGFVPLSLTFPLTQSIGPLLGFPYSILDPPILVVADNSTFSYPGGIFISLAQAKFDSVGSYLFCSSLGNGLPVNSSRSGCLAQIPISASAGGQILFQPNVPTKIDMSGLVGKTLNTLEFFLLDQSGNELIFNQEINTFLICFRWLEPADRFSPNSFRS